MVDMVGADDDALMCTQHADPIKFLCCMLSVRCAAWHPDADAFLPILRNHHPSHRCYRCYIILSKTEETQSAFQSLGNLVLSRTVMQQRSQLLLLLAPSASIVKSLRSTPISHLSSVPLFVRSRSASTYADFENPPLSLIRWGDSLSAAGGDIMVSGASRTICARDIGRRQ